MIRIEHLLTFAVVAQEGNVTRAAERLYRTQPAISVQMRQLSEACGEPLYTKHAEGVHLTEAGKGLLVHAQAISRAYENTKRYAKDRKDLSTGSLGLVASLTIGVYLLPELLAQFETQFPQLTIQLSTRYSQLALETLLSGQAELAFVELPAAQLTHLATEFVCKEFHRDEILLVASPRHPITREHKSLEQIAKQYKIVWAEPGSGTRQVVETMFEENGIDCKKYIEVTGIEAIKRAVGKNLGIAFLSHLAVEQELATGQVVSIDFGKPPLFRPFTLIHPHRDLCSNVCKAFLESAGLLDPALD